MLVLLLSGCGISEENQAEGPILPVEQARRQAEQAWLASERAYQRADWIFAYREQVLADEHASTYDRVEAEAQYEVAEDQMVESLIQVFDTEHELWRTLQHLLGEGTEAFWLAWDEWESWKDAHPLELGQHRK